MKKAVITISYDEEKLDALQMYLEEKGIDLDKELIKTIDTLYTKNVPLAVKEYLDKKYKSAINKKNQEVKGNGQHRSPSAV